MIKKLKLKLFLGFFLFLGFSLINIQPVLAAETTVKIYSKGNLQKGFGNLLIFEYETKESLKDFSQGPDQAQVGGYSLTRIASIPSDWANIIAPGNASGITGLAYGGFYRVYWKGCKNVYQRSGSSSNDLSGPIWCEFNPGSNLEVYLEYPTEDLATPTLAKCKDNKECIGKIIKSCFFRGPGDPDFNTCADNALKPPVVESKPTSSNGIPVVVPRAGDPVIGVLKDGTQAQVFISPATFAKLQSGTSLAVVFDNAPEGLSAYEKDISKSSNGVAINAVPPIYIQVTPVNSGTGLVTSLTGDILEQPVTILLPKPRLPRGFSGEESTSSQIETVWFRELKVDGKFAGYIRPPQEIDQGTGFIKFQLPLNEMQGTLFIPAYVQKSYVQNHKAEIRIYSGPTEDAIDFTGPDRSAAPQFTTFEVTGPQITTKPLTGPQINRIPVYNPVTGNYGWIDVEGVGSSGPPVNSLPLEKDPKAEAEVKAFACRVSAVTKIDKNKVRVEVEAINGNQGYNRARWYLSRENTNDLYNAEKDHTKFEYINSGKPGSSSNYQFDSLKDVKENGESDPHENSVTELEVEFPNLKYYIQPVAYTFGDDVVKREATPCVYSGKEGIKLSEMELNQRVEIKKIASAKSKKSFLAKADNLGSNVLGIESAPFTTGINVLSSTGDAIQVCANITNFSGVDSDFFCQTVGSGKTAYFTVNDPSNTNFIATTATALTPAGTPSNSTSLTLALPTITGTNVSGQIPAQGGFEQQVNLSLSGGELDPENPIVYMEDLQEIIAYTSNVVTNPKVINLIDNKVYDLTGFDSDCQVNSLEDNIRTCVYRKILNEDFAEGEYILSLASGDLVVQQGKEIKFTLKKRTPEQFDPCPDETLEKAIIFRSDDVENLYPGVIFENCQWQTTPFFNLSDENNGDNGFKLFKQFKDGTTQTDFLVVKKLPKQATAEGVGASSNDGASTGEQPAVPGTAQVIPQTRDNADGTYTATEADGTSKMFSYGNALVTEGTEVDSKCVMDERLGREVVVPVVAGQDQFPTDCQEIDENQICREDVDLNSGHLYASCVTP